MKKEFIKLERWEVLGNRINYTYSYPDSFGKYLKKSSEGQFYVEYPTAYDLSDVPESVITVPFVAAILSLSMITGNPIEVNQLDEDFYGSLSKMRNVYKKQFPYIDFCFDVKVVGGVKKHNNNAGKAKSVFFTGGLDATSALVEKAHEKVMLVNIWGGDVSISQEKSHEELDRYMARLTQSLDLSYLFIKSNIREMYNEPLISKYTAFKVNPAQNHGWWANFAHIISMTSLLAPLIYQRDIDVHYIGSSYDGLTIDANNDDLVDAIKILGCRMEMVDSTLGRIEKAGKMITFSEQNHIPLSLKVCWYAKDGVNCSHCEKCYRTILEILVNRGNPNDYGFLVDKETYKNMHKFLKTTYVNAGFYKPIFNKFIEDRAFWENNTDLSWILTLKLNGINARIHRVIYLGNKLVHFLKK